MPSVYLALIIPIIVTTIFYLFKKHEFTWWEFFIPIAAVLVATFISKVVVDHTSVSFTEYWGSSVTSVYEEEPYNYWQHETCSYTTTDSKGNTTTHYYDCSHQVDVGPSWWATTNINEQFSISEKQHDELVKQFGTRKTVYKTRTNHDSNDRATSSKGTKFEGTRVGKTSNILKTNWNGSDETRKAYVSRHTYENRVKASDLTIFNIPIVKEEEVDSLGLFRYPEHKKSSLFGITNGLEYPTILGCNVSKETHEKFRRLNGKFGVSNHLRLWILVFENKPMSIAQYQENYWVKGNQNELVICIGKKGNEIQWSHAFSWGLNDVLTVSIKNAVLDLYEYNVTTNDGKTFPISVPITKDIISKAGVDTSMLPPAFVLKIPKTDVKNVTKSKTPVLTEQTWNEFYNYLNENLNQFKRRDFEEFSYLKVEPSKGAVIFIYILAFVISIATGIWVTTNDIYEGSENNYNKRYNKGNHGRRFY